MFGNISLKALNGELEGQDGKEEYRRLTEHMLPEADIAFLDEIWKASPAILNTLLTIVNERKFHNGSKVEDVPLKALFAASNELPAKDRGLEALYDRFILRLCVGYIESEDNFFDMIDGESSSEFALDDETKKLQITNDELKDWKRKIDAVTLSEEAKAVIGAIRKELTARNTNMSDEDKKNGELWEVGDRRWKKIAHILKASAFLNDRTAVDLMDCQLIEYCIWSTSKQQTQARDIVEKCIKQNGLDCDTAIEEINEQIGEFTASVNEQWFEEVEEDETDKIVVVDGRECYECVLNGTNETWYVSVGQEETYPYNNYHNVYNTNRKHQAYSSFSKNGDTVSCWKTFKIKRNPAKTHIEAKSFSDIAHETLQKSFDKKQYAPIVDKIQSEIKMLKDKKEADAVPFKANLFANQEYNTSITAKVDGAIHQLEDAKVSLDKQRNRYFKSELAAELSVGDVILKNGIVYTADEIENLTDEQKEAVIAVVCIPDGLADTGCYAISLSETKMRWNNLDKFEGKGVGDFPKEFEDNWIVPNKELLAKVWANREKINEVLKTIGGECSLLEPHEYWSSSANGDSAAFYQLFDERGHQDHTTKDHEYAVRVIREWNKH